MKRQRPVTSCLPCRQKRVRCDRVHPSCQRCETGGVDCTYDETALSRSTDPVQSSETQNSSSAPTVQEPTRHSVGIGRRGYVAESAVEHFSSEKGTLSVYGGGRSAYVGSTFWANAIPAEPDRGLLLGETPSILGDRNSFPTLPLKMQDEGLEWMGQKFRPPRSCDFFWSKASSNKCRLCGRNYNLSCVMALLPPRKICEKLCGYFFSTVFPLMPVFHMKSFADDFRIFWNEVRSGNVHDSEPGLLLRRKPGFLSLLSAVLFSALASASQSRLNRLLEHAPGLNAGDIYFSAMASATLTGFPRRPSIYSLAAYIIAQSQFVREEEFSDAPDFIATAFRIALGMGLHRQLPQSELGTAELETRRRLWWYILHLDVMSSSSSGLAPLFINQKMANTEAICHHDAPESGSHVEQAVDIRYLVASHRYTITKEMREILLHHFEDAFQSLGTVNECERRLQMIADHTNATVHRLLQVRVDTETRQSSNSNSESQPASECDADIESFDRVWTVDPDPGNQECLDFSAWAALLLHLMVHKAFCVLYHPLFRDSTMGAHKSIRTKAIRHAQAFVQSFIRVCNDPISEPYHWMYPGTYQPLQAVSLLLAGILEQPYGDDAPLSRGLIDAIFELYQVDEGMVSQHDPPRRQLSPSGRDAWIMLVQTRRRALEQIGIDHHVLFPSTIVSSNTCICGQSIAAASTGPDHQIVSMSQFGTALRPAGAPGFDDEAREPTTGHMLMDQVDFDWDAWDSALGPSVGLMQ